jgi:hypothetical protein
MTDELRLTKYLERNSHDLIAVHFWHLLGGTEEYHENINQGNRIPGKDSKQAHLIIQHCCYITSLGSYIL